MTDKHGRRSPREIAEELKQLAAVSNADRATLIHEVQVYQEELMAQNDALREMQSQLEETRDRFIELYDFAPNGYLTIDEHGIVHQINLTGAAWLAKSKQAIHGMPIGGFVAVGDRQAVMDFLRKCRNYQEGPSVNCHVHIRSTEATRAVELICRPRTVGRLTRQYFIAMIDVTEQQRLEAERQADATARAALAGRLMSIQEDERRRIARDLHDNIGQQMTALRLRLDALIGAARNEPALSTRLVDTLTLIDNVDQSLDFIATELRPAVLDLGLASAIEQFVREWSATFDIPAAFDVHEIDRLRLPRDTEAHLYRIAQEALNNVYKHAHATSVAVRLRRRRNDLLLLIADNGCGMVEPGAADREGRTGIGLVSMRERAALIGATLDLDSSPGRGTTVSVRLADAMIEQKAST
jgi:signal transduction histidine kinase